LYISYMERIKWREVYSQDEVSKAALHFTKKCLYLRYKALNTSWDDETLFQFLKDSERRLARIHRMLSGPVDLITFHPYLRKEIKIKDKIRRLHIATWNDRIVDAMLNRILLKATSGWLSKNAYAFRNKSNSLHVCQRRIKQRLRTHPFIIKRDIRSFYDSINHDKMLEVLRNIVDDDFYTILEKKVRFSYTKDDPENAVRAEIGLSFGSSLAPILSNILLTPIDHKLEQFNDVIVFRYADDVLMMSSNPDSALQAARMLDSEIGALGLILKPSATFDLSFEPHPQFKHVDRFKHLGLEFHKDGSIRLSGDKIHKITNLFRFAMARKSKKLSRIHSLDDRLTLLIEIANNELTRIRPMSVIDYYMHHTTDEGQYRMIDAWLAEEILARSLGTGHKKGNFKKVPFSKLRSMGLISLVHRRRLIQHGHMNDSFELIRNRYLKSRSHKSRRQGSVVGASAVQQPPG
jgi:retron-type reverse transcriptase